MNLVADLLPPTQYDLGWGIIAVAILVIAAIFYVVLLLMTRKKKPEPLIHTLPTVAYSSERSLLIKTKYAEAIRNVGLAHEVGELSTRKAFQALSVYLRNFVHEYSGTGAYAMTLKDMSKAQTPALLQDKVRNYYPLAFEEANRTGNVKLAVEDAIKLVELWY